MKQNQNLFCSPTLHVTDNTVCSNTFGFAQIDFTPCSNVDEYFCYSKISLRALDLSIETKLKLLELEVHSEMNDICAPIVGCALREDNWAALDKIERKAINVKLKHAEICLRNTALHFLYLPQLTGRENRRNRKKWQRQVISAGHKHILTNIIMVL